MATEPETIEAPRRTSPAVVVVAAVLGLVLLVVLWLFVVKPLLFPGEERAPTPPAASPRPKASPSPSPSPPPPPPETFEVFESKDPFRPLIVEGAAAAASPAPGAAGGPAPTGGQRVALLDIFTDAGVTKAQVRVGSTVFTVTVGEVFAENFKLVSVSGNCGTFLHGDDKFTLCEGEEVIK